ncbi:Argonaute siRNA chaperone complex subunit Arb1-domain-containing protein [Gamsiella multidivaricata]|uniref:Argonaute siRNA chaperone complex subunit Arb1-domain-containing protein n=1 Tax=Gamsiella multidivaricata TaxID=101098 RepID=UPI00221EA73F|nr:Argonaute siRNA chaperone complex subunit Arb1-domain-containing protein [Gamsiella multidivaricata]KAI7825610.1 Argonaute siRNA chaperone complex subunit Arb1-domain-containing protein [Gamsiella multidivaricata]
MRLAIDNFRKERNFVPMSNKILETYFSYGGMDEHPVVVGGAKRTQGAEVTLDIDFVYVVASFLSSHVLNSGIWHDVTYFEMAPRVVLAFLKYIHVRRVMPEYEVEIKKAIDIAQLAKVQTPQCKTFNRMMPDDYSQSCTIHFVREYRSDPLPDKSDELLKQCMGDSSSTKDVQVEGEHMGYARVLRILSENTDEQIGATAAVDPTRVDKIEAATGDTVSLPAADAAEVVVDGPVDPTTANDDKHPTAKTVNPPTVDATGSSTVDTVAPASADEIKPVVVDAADTAVVDTNVLATVDKADTAIVANEALVDAASLSTDDGALAAAPNATKDDSTGLVKLEQPLTSIIVLEPMILEDGVLLPTHGKDYSIRVSSEAAALLGGGTILWGKFYTLSNDTVFARPLMAYPSFHVEEDEEFSSW